MSRSCSPLFRTSKSQVRKGAEVRRKGVRTSLRTLPPPFRGGVRCGSADARPVPFFEVRKILRCGR